MKKYIRIYVNRRSFRKMKGTKPDPVTRHVQNSLMRYWNDKKCKKKENFKYVLLTSNLFYVDIWLVI
jgi:hypothetical protein